MQLSSTKNVPASVPDTYASLTDPDFLKDCIPGCESIEADADGKYLVTLAAKVGPVSARFNGSMMIVNPQPPHSYKLVFEGKGGPAGFAKGSADVSLAPAAVGTNLTYTVDAQVGGKIAQVGSRLIEAAAKKVADDFFDAFTAKMHARAPQLAAVPAPGAPAQEDRQGTPSWAYAAIGFGVLLVAGVAWLTTR